MEERKEWHGPTSFGERQSIAQRSRLKTFTDASFMDPMSRKYWEIFDGSWQACHADVLMDLATSICGLCAVAGVAYLS
jgi:hypothetical protein